MEQIPGSTNAGTVVLSLVYRHFSVAVFTYNKRLAFTSSVKHVYCPFSVIGNLRLDSFTSCVS